MANEGNLIPNSMRSPSEVRENSRKGGINSGKARREKADFKRKCQIWMETVVAEDSKGNPMTGSDVMVATAARELSNGNPRFWELMRDTAGYKPVEKVMVAEVDQGVIDEVESLVLGNDTDDANESTGN